LQGFRVCRLRRINNSYSPGMEYVVMMYFDFAANAEQNNSQSHSASDPYEVRGIIGARSHLEEQNDI
jgi:hypothetical protein